MRWLQRFLCSRGWCMECVPAGNDHYLWGECINCGKRHGEISRECIRWHMARERGAIK